MIVANGTADVTTYWVLRDSTTHAPKTAVDVTTLDLYYIEELAAISAKADCVALAAATTAHTDSYGFEIGLGVYRIDWPDTCFNGGAGKKVILIVVGAGIDTSFLEVELSPSVTANVTTWLGTACATPTVAGVPEVDATHWLGTACATPTVAGVPEVDATHWRGAAIPETAPTPFAGT